MKKREVRCCNVINYESLSCGQSAYMRMTNLIYYHQSVESYCAFTLV